MARTYHESQDKPTYVDPRDPRDRRRDASAASRSADGGRAPSRASTIPASPSSSGAVRRAQVEGRQVSRPGRRPARAVARSSASSWSMLLCAWVPGALGLFLRSKLYPLLLGRVGRNVVFGANVTLRHPHKIHIGDNVVIDDHCCLDAKGTDNRGITIGNGVFVGRNTILSCKNGDIVIDDRRQHRLQLRDLLGVARARRRRRPDGGVHLSRGRRSPLRSRRHPGARAGPHRARHRRRRPRLARRARRRHRRLARSAATRSSAPARSSSARSRSSRSRRGSRRRSCAIGAEPPVDSRASTAPGPSPDMCGIVGIVESRSEPAGRPRTSCERMVRTLHAPRPRRRGQRHAARRRPRHAPAGDRRSRRRPAAVRNEDGDDPARRQRRDLQLPRAAAASSSARGHRFRTPLRHRSRSSTPTRSGARRS